MDPGRQDVRLGKNRLVINLVKAFDARLTGGPCEPFVQDVRLAIEARDMFTYPDLMVVCGEIEKYRDRNDTVTNPTAIVEVLSASTRDYDRGTKLEGYRTLASLEEYLLVDQHRIWVDQYTRKGDFWQLRDHRDPNGSIQLDKLGFELPLEEIYRGIVVEDKG